MAKRRRYRTNTVKDIAGYAERLIRERDELARKADSAAKKLDLYNDRLLEAHKLVSLAKAIKSEIYRLDSAEGKQWKEYKSVGGGTKGLRDSDHATKIYSLMIRYRSESNKLMTEYRRIGSIVGKIPKLKKEIKWWSKYMEETMEDISRIERDIERYLKQVGY